MQSPNDPNEIDQDGSTAGQPGAEAEAALAEISRILNQMLFLAELSASSCSVDRAVLQKELEQLQRKLNNIADSL